MCRDVTNIRAKTAEINIRLGMGNLQLDGTFQSDRIRLHIAAPNNNEY